MKNLWVGEGVYNSTICNGMNSQTGKSNYIRDQETLHNFKIIFIGFATVFSKWILWVAIQSFLPSRFQSAFPPLLMELPTCFPKCIWSLKREHSVVSSVIKWAMFTGIHNCTSEKSIPLASNVSVQQWPNVSVMYQWPIQCISVTVAKLYQCPIGHQCISVTLLQQQWRNVTVMYHWPMCISGQCNVSVLPWPNVSVQQCSGSGQQPIWPRSAPFFT